MVRLDPDNAVAPWVCLVAKGDVLYLGLRLDSKGLVSMKEKHVLCCEAREAVAAGILQAEGASLGLFQELGLQDPQGMTHMENRWRHHGCHAFLGADPTAAPAAAVRGGASVLKCSQW